MIIHITVLFVVSLDILELVLVPLHRLWCAHTYCLFLWNLDLGFYMAGIRVRGIVTYRWQYNLIFI